MEHGGAGAESCEDSRENADDTLDDEFPQFFFVVALRHDFRSVLHNFGYILLDKLLNKLLKNFFHTR